ncbi:hypothetical protein CSPX01_03609, partial [Colletotrichum filicis]
MLPRCRHFRLPSLWHLAVEHGSGNLDHRLSSPRETEWPGHRPKLGLPSNKARPPAGIDSHCSLSAAANQRGGLEAKGEPRRASGQVPEHGRPQDRAQGKEKAREDSWQGHL